MSEASIKRTFSRNVLHIMQIGRPADPNSLDLRTESLLGVYYIAMDDNNMRLRGRIRIVKY